MPPLPPPNLTPPQYANMLQAISRLLGAHLGLMFQANVYSMFAFLLRALAASIGLP